MFTDTIYKKNEGNFNRSIKEDSSNKDVKFDKIINKGYGIFTSIVRISGSYSKIIPVKSNKPINKKLWIECSKALSRLHVRAPINMGDTICTNILNTGVDIIATRTINKSCD